MIKVFEWSYVKWRQTIVGDHRCTRRCWRGIFPWRCQSWKVLSKPTPSLRQSMLPPRPCYCLHSRIAVSYISNSYYTTVLHNTLQQPFFNFLIHEIITGHSGNISWEKNENVEVYDLNSPHGKQILASILMLILPRNNRMEDEIWGMGYLWLGPRCEPDRYGQCKTNRLRIQSTRGAYAR